LLARIAQRSGSVHRSAPIVETLYTSVMQLRRTSVANTDRLPERKDIWQLTLLGR